MEFKELWNYRKVRNDLSRKFSHVLAEYLKEFFVILD